MVVFMFVLEFVLDFMLAMGLFLSLNPGVKNEANGS